MMGAAAGMSVLFLILSAVLTAAHAAAFHIGSSRMRTLHEEGFTGADALGEVRATATAVESSVRLTTSALNLGALGVGVSTGAVTWGYGGPIVDVLIGIVLIVGFTDIAPRGIAARHPVRIALASAPILLRVRRWTRFIWGTVSRLEVALGRDGADELSTEERELRELQEIGQEEGILEESENQLVERAFRLDELTAWDVMVPRVDIFAWPRDLTVADILDGLEDLPYSRVPVYRESVDDVTGIVYIRELYERIAAGQQDVKLAELSHEPFFVPGSLSCAQLLSDFQARRIHMGLVADEFGGTDGLVTLEDVLEELVGEIHDETDLAEEEIYQLSETQLECDAGVDVREINEALAVSLPKDEHRSLNGLILEEFGHVPAEGDSFVTAGVRIDVVEASETQVLRARVTRLVAKRDPADH
jgi:putative hemolysin